MKKEITVKAELLQEEIVEGLEKALARFENEEDAAAYLISFAVRELGFAKSIRGRKQRSINLGRMGEGQRLFLWDFADKVCRGKLQEAAFYMIETVLNCEDGIAFDRKRIDLFNHKETLDVEALMRRGTRKEDAPLVASYSEDRDDLIERFSVYAGSHGGNKQAFASIIKKFEGICHEAKIK